MVFARGASSEGVALEIGAPSAGWGTVVPTLSGSELTGRVLLLKVTTCTIRGFVDVLIDRDDGTTGIVDFKTTVPRPSTWPRTRASSTPTQWLSSTPRAVGP